MATTQGEKLTDFWTSLRWDRYKNWNVRFYFPALIYAWVVRLHKVMHRKVRTTLYLDENLVKEAKDMGLNISKTVENCLKEKIELLKPAFPKKAKGPGPGISSREISNPGRGIHSPEG